MRHSGERFYRKIKYPADFIKDVKRAAPDNDEIHEALDQGWDIVGDMLDGLSSWSPKPKEVVQAFEERREQEVLEDARKHALYAELHNRWIDLQQPTD